MSDFSLPALAFGRCPHPFPFISSLYFLSTDQDVASVPHAVVDGERVAVGAEEPPVDLVPLLEHHEDTVPAVVHAARRQLDKFYMLGAIHN